MNQPINAEHLQTRIAEFIDARRTLQNIVMQCFPIGCRVRVKTTGEVGKVHTTVHGFPESLSIKFASGCSWPMQVTELERIE